MFRDFRVMEMHTVQKKPCSVQENVTSCLNLFKYKVRSFFKLSMVSHGSGSFRPQGPHRGPAVLLEGTIKLTLKLSAHVCGGDEKTKKKWQSQTSQPKTSNGDTVETPGKTKKKTG